jgi:hypothetical protein
MHLVGFDAPGESLEMRLTARDRSAYASGAITAAEWLLAEPRAPGFHSFDEVVDSIIEKQSTTQSPATGFPSPATGSGSGSNDLQSPANPGPAAPDR